MHLGVVGFIVAVILLILTVAIVLAALRARNADRHAMNYVPAEQEEVQLPPRDWAASVKPIRVRPTEPKTELKEIRPYRVPDYRGRSQGTVRRVNGAALRRTRQSGHLDT